MPEQTDGQRRGLAPATPWIERRCRDCRYWKPPTRSVREPFGECRRGASEDGLREFPTSLAFAVDRGLDAAALLTHPEFGCLQFLERSGEEREGGR